MGMVLPPQPDKFLDDVRAGYRAPLEAGHENVIMLKQYTMVSIDIVPTWGLLHLLFMILWGQQAALDAVLQAQQHCKAARA